MFLYLFPVFYWTLVDSSPPLWWRPPWHRRLNHMAAVWAHRNCLLSGKCVCRSVRWQWRCNWCWACWESWKRLCMWSCWSAWGSGSLEHTELQQHRRITVLSSPPSLLLRFGHVVTCFVCVRGAGAVTPPQVAARGDGHRVGCVAGQVW